MENVRGHRGRGGRRSYGRGQQLRRYDVDFTHGQFSVPFFHQAVMPFYVLHQPVIVVLAFLLRTIPVNPILKFVLLYTSSFIIIMAIYHLLVWRVGVLRFLFGMKPIDTVNTFR